MIYDKYRKKLGPSERLYVQFEGNTLEDGRALEDYGIKNGSVLTAGRGRFIKPTKAKVCRC